MAQKSELSTVSHWDAYWKQGNLEYVNKIVEELQKTGPLTGKTILEIGAGSGATSIKLAQLGGTVICLDYSVNAINVIRRNTANAKTKVFCVLADANTLPFRKETVDTCFHQGFLEHFEDLTKLLSEQYRVLKQNGVLCADVPQRYSLYTLKKHVLMKMKKWFAGWETEFSIASLRNVISAQGFRFQWGYGRFHVRNLDRIQLRLFKKIFIPRWVEVFYYAVVKKLENTFWGTHTAFSIGIIARK
jgi:ubiquinone/menaquinone biosynthesis C-methylase UbiE